MKRLIGRLLYPTECRTVWGAFCLGFFHGTVVVVAAAALVLWAGTAWGQPKARELWEYRELVQIVCRQESQGEADPDEAVGKANELGRCQIKPRVAKEHGYRFAALAVAEVSYQAATAVLLACTRNMRHWWLKDHPWAYRHAYCYKEGAWSDGNDLAAHRYAKLAASDYAAAKLVAMTTFQIAER